MYSATNRPRRGRIKATKVQDETYDLRGINHVAPDQIMPEGESPHALNTRSYPREDTERRVSLRTRQGTSYLSEPRGQAANTSNVAAAATDIEFSSDRWVSTGWTPNASGRLTKLEVHAKKPSTGGGIVIVELWTSVAGLPNALLGRSSFPTSSLTSSYDYVAARFMDAPAVTSGTTYQIQVYLQELSTGTFNLNGTAGSGNVTTDKMESFSPLGNAFRYKSYITPAAVTKGYVRYYPADNADRTVVAIGNELFEVEDNGTFTEIGTNCIDALSDRVRFAIGDDKVYFVDQLTEPQVWDGSSVANATGAPDAATNIVIYHNRLFFYGPDPNRIVFSDLYPDWGTFDGTSFFYIPAPDSSDPLTGWVVWKDDLVIFTRKTKYVVNLPGDGISGITIQEAVGTKGAISQELMAADKDGIYFVSSDDQLYRWNGADDELLSAKVEPEIASADSARLMIHRNQVRLYYAKSPSTVANRMLLYDIPTKQWFLDTGKLIVGAVTWDQDNNELVEFGSQVPQLYFGDDGPSDLGRPIEFVYWTNYKSYGSGLAKDRVKIFRPYIRPAESPYYLNVYKDVDFMNDPGDPIRVLVTSGGAVWGGGPVWGDGTVYGEGTEIVDTKVQMPGRGKFTQYRFESSGVGTTVEIYGYGAEIKIGKRR